MTENYYDVIIIGGGPAGSTCAIFLKKNNPALRVCIIDKQSFPRKKACGDGLSPKVVDIVKEAGLTDLFSSKLAISTFTLSCGNSVEIDYNLRQLSENYSHGFVYPREYFDEKLIQQAIDMGVDVFQKHEVGEMQEISKWCTKIFLRSGGRNFYFFGKTVVGADGARSIVRNYLRIPSNDDEHMGISLRYYCNIDSAGDMPLRIDILKTLKYSYGWVFPITTNLANVGIGVDVSIYKKDRINLNVEFEKYLAFLKGKMKLTLVEGSRGGFTLPYGSQMPKLVTGNKILIGDAASMINPLTGEGIYYAMFAGKTLAENIANNLDDDNKLEDALVKFSLEFENQFQQHYALNLRIKKLLSSSFSGVLLSMIAKDKALLGKVMNVILGNSNDLNTQYLGFKIIKRSAKYVYEQFKSNLSKQPTGLS